MTVDCGPVARVPCGLSSPGPVATIMLGVGHPVPIGVPLARGGVVVVWTASGPLPTPSTLAPGPCSAPPPISTGGPVALPLLLRHPDPIPVLRDGPRVLHGPGVGGPGGITP